MIIKCITYRLKSSKIIFCNIYKECIYCEDTRKLLGYGRMNLKSMYSTNEHVLRKIIKIKALTNVQIFRKVSDESNLSDKQLLLISIRFKSQEFFISLYFQWKRIKWLNSSLEKVSVLIAMFGCC